MTDNPNETEKQVALAPVPALPDFERMKNSVTFTTPLGDMVSYDDLDMLDLDHRHIDRLPLLRAGQADENKGSYEIGEGKKKEIVRPLEKRLFLEVPSYSEDDSSDKPTWHNEYEELPSNTMFLLPVAYDQNRKFWKSSYDPDNTTEPDCQSQRYLKLPIPDEKYITRDDTGRPISSVISHACMTGDRNGAKAFCPLATWVDGKPACTHFAYIYGLLYHPANDDVPDGYAPRLVVVAFKRGSIDSGIAVQKEMKKAVRAGLSPWNAPVKLSHGKPNEKKQGYAVFGTMVKQAGKPLTTDEFFPGFTEQHLDLLIEASTTANETINAARDYASNKPIITVNGADKVVDGVDTPF